MARKPGYRFISVQLTPKQYAAVRKAAGTQEIATYLRSVLITSIPDFPDDMPKRGKHRWDAKERS